MAKAMITATKRTAKSPCTGIETISSAGPWANCGGGREQQQLRERQNYDR